MKMSVSKISKAMGVSVRTLHYYDEIGLLKPKETSDAGYRFYDDESVSLLQQILFFRELDFSLAEIKTILSNPDYDKTQTLKKHRDLLLLKRIRLDEMLRIVDETIGGNKMNNIKVTAADIESAKKKYTAEVKEKWGGTAAYKESEEKHAGYDKEKEIMIAEKANEIIMLFAKAAGKNPAGPEVQKLVKQWQDYITEYHYKCTNEILSCLGQMYVNDERFTENIDRFGIGTAKLMSEAIAVYCK